MKIEIWSDFACPYCYIGEKKLEKALEEFQDKDDVEITFRSFQLDPNGVKHAGEDINELLAQKYGISYQRAKEQNDSIINAAYDVGLKYRFDILTPNNTALAHEVAKFAKSQCLEKVVVERLFKAYFEEGSDLGDKETLLSLAKEVGLDTVKLEKSLNEEVYKNDVIMDQQNAYNNGIHGVPYFIINDKVAISGAQSISYFKEALNKASEM